tara:strand:+ start:4650 stop:5486 length:837 start_codon:yes stop_codon:yes gene_type:complete
MAQVVLPTTFIDGQALPVDDLNKALYSGTSGEGLYSEPNGGIQLQATQNGGTDFELRQEHLQPEQVIKTRFDGGWHTLDNMSDVSGQTTVEDNNVNVARTQSLPGCGLRIYVPFDAVAVRWNISFFFYVAKWLGLTEDAQNNLYSEGGSIQTFLFVDGAEKVEWRREFPMTWFKRAVADYATSSGSGNNHNASPYSTEAEQASFMNLSYLQTEVEQGFHEAYLGFYVKPTKASGGGVAKFLRETVIKYDKSNSTVKKNLELYQRLGIGCRNARVVAFR